MALEFSPYPFYKIQKCNLNEQIDTFKTKKNYQTTIILLNFV